VLEQWPLHTLRIEPQSISTRGANNARAKTMTFKSGQLWAEMRIAQQVELHRSTFR